MRVQQAVHAGRPWVFDTTLALVALVASQVEASSRAADGYAGGSAVASHALGVVLSVPLVLRRRAPVVALSTMVLGTLLLSLGWAHSLHFWTDFLPLCLAVYPAARLVDGWFGRWSWVGAALAVDATMLHTPSTREVSNAVFSAVVLGACALSGRLVRRGARTKARLAETIEQLAREQRRTEEAAVREERGRIAREVQDVVAHAVGSMLVQVGAARLELDGARQPVPAQLMAAEETGRRALAELRRSVRPEEPGAAPREPLPNLSRLPELVRGFEHAGLAVHLEQGCLGTLPADLEVNVYRILQESLTNALRHAGRVSVQAGLRVEDGALVLDVRNPMDRGARPLALPSGGHGLRGMRERVAMFDGSLTAGPQDDCFVVRAVLPLPHPDGLAMPRRVEAIS